MIREGGFKLNKGFKLNQEPPSLFLTSYISHKDTYNCDLQDKLR